MIQILMVLETIWNISMVKLGESHLEEMDVKLLSGLQLLTDGAVQIQT
jgi:hypothetical protein